MINEFSVNAKPSNNKAKVAFWVLIGLAALDFAAYLLMRALEVQKSGLVGMLSLVFITAAVLIYTKYVSPKYYYDIMNDSDGTAIFVVRQVIGKRQSTLCRIGLAEIQRVDRESAEERRAHKTPFSHKKYVYLPTLRPSATYRLTTRNRYEQAEIIIEISDEFANLLVEYIKEAKEIELLREANDPY